MADEVQVLVRFTTKLPNDLRVPGTEVAVPASLKRYGLSQIINHMLSLDPPRPFDFLIDGELVRRSLQSHLLEHSISPELVVEVEYIPAVIPPEPEASVPHDDWVTAVAALGSELLCSGGADGVVRGWDGKCTAVVDFAAHEDGVNDLVSVPGGPHNSAAGTDLQLLSCGKDRTARLWALQQQDSTGGGSSSKRSSVQCLAVCEAHTDAVQCVAASPAGGVCASGGWDGQLLMWRVGEHDLTTAAAAAADADAADPPAARKRRRGARAEADSGVPPPTLQPSAALPGHVQCVSALTWPSQHVLYSGGWDHSVRRYDPGAATNTDTYNGSKAILAVAAAGTGSPDVVAFGGADRALRVWDTRATGEALAVNARTAAEGWVAALAWRPGSAHQLASASHDGAVKLWDLRTPVPLAALREHAAGSKALAVAWWDAARLVSGGSDCKLQTYSLP